MTSSYQLFTVLNGERLKTCILKSKQDSFTTVSHSHHCQPLSAPIFNIALEVLARTRRQEKEIKGI